MRHLLILGLLALTKAKDILIHSKIDETVKTEAKDTLDKDGSTRKTETFADKGGMSELERFGRLTLIVPNPHTKTYTQYTYQVVFFIGPAHFHVAKENNKEPTRSFLGRRGICQMFLR